MNSVLLHRLFSVRKLGLAFLILTALFFSFYTIVFAAEKTITTTANTSAAYHIVSGSTVVFVSDQVGYKFFRTAAAIDGACAYRKTTDGGSSWGGEVIFDSQTDCAGAVVWFDKWTPGDTGNYIHIVSMEVAGVPDQLWYNRLDTTNDTLLKGSSPVNVSSNSSQGGTFSAGSNKPAITKGTDGTIYIGISDNSDSYVVECSTGCGTATSWTETGSNPLDTVDNDFNLLAPLANGDILLINRDTSFDDIRSKVWNNTTWSAGWSNVDTSALGNTAYDVGMSLDVNGTNGNVYLAYIADNDDFTTADHDIRTAIYNGSSWSNTNDVVTNIAGGLTNVTLGIDANTDDVYVGYSKRTTIGNSASANIYWASSTAAMTSWGGEQGPLNSSADDFYGLSLNQFNDQRLYLTWYAAGTDYIYGDTILDTSPATMVSVIGNQILGVRASSTNNYLGGTIVISEALASRNLTSITITETGTVDAANNLKNIKLFYDLDTSAPYDCSSETYSGTESQYGTTDTNGFSGSNGVSTFSAGGVSISPTQAFCGYVVFDTTKDAVDGSYIDVTVNDPQTDVVVSGGVTPTPTIAVPLTGSTTIANFPLLQHGYHWRNDDGNEAAASSATGGTQNSQPNDLSYDTPIRVRVSLYNDGSTSTIGSQLQLEYATRSTTCSAAIGWVALDDADDAFSMVNSTFLTNGEDTTDISVANGGITNPDTYFKTPNGAVLDTTDKTVPINIDSDEYVELEFAISASSSAVQGQTYCFRVTDNGEEINTYNQYPTIKIATDVVVSAYGTHVTSAEIPATDVYVGGAFVVTENSNSRDVTDINIKQVGTIDGATDVNNIRLFYDLDTSAPYDCSSESYSGTETQFGATDTDGFSAAQGTVSFTDSLTISTTSTACFYTVMDVTSQAQSNTNIKLAINDPSADVSVNGGGTVSPDTLVSINGSTTVAGAVVTLSGYHWRNDDGDETGATSATAGSANTILSGVAKNEPYRLRIGLSNTGGTSSEPKSYKLQFGSKITTCDAVVGWTDVGATNNDTFDMFDSVNLTNADNTTDIALSSGGVSNGTGSFVTANTGVRDTSDTSATTSLPATDYYDLEFSITTTPNTPYETDYCFRLLESGQEMVAYDYYPELTTTANRDFKIQRGSTVVNGTGITLYAGSDYIAPASTSTAFVRITNSHHTGSGMNNGGGNQNPDDVTAYITAADDITSSFTITRDSDSINQTYVDWEIIEFTGGAGTDNEMIVRNVGALSLAAGATVGSSSVISSVTDDSDVVVFITGARTTAASRVTYQNIQFTSQWDSVNNQAVFKRIANAEDADIGYAIVEFTGQNWNIQRVEHTYTAAGSYETENITPVSSLNKAFIYTQKRMPNDGLLADFGHLVYLSSIGAVSFYLEPLTANPTTHVSVAWVMENNQAGLGSMQVFRSSGNTTGGPEPSLINTAIGGTLKATNNASIFANTALNSTDNSFPRALAGFAIFSTSTYNIWRSDTGLTLDYRTEVVEWPAADIAMRQNYYRFYTDNGALKPDDPWPAGATDLGENLPITPLDESLSDGERVRVRMSVKVSNGTIVSGAQSLKLQYAELATTCSAIDTWNDVGAAGSGEIWRGYDLAGVSDGAVLSTNPPTGGDLLLSVSDRSGTFEESNDTAPNPYNILAGEDVEYDFILENNGAKQKVDYCFRLVQSTGVALVAYLNYPQLRTNGYAPVTEAWQWFDDETNEMPNSALALESVSPVEIQKDNTIKLRVTVDEVNNLTQNNTKFKLQFSDGPSFTNVFNVAATSTCTVSDIWCYADGIDADNATITQSVLSTSDMCIAGTGPGCGNHNESPNAHNGFVHSAFTAQEYEFTIKYQDVIGYYGQVWYFRLYDVTNDEYVPINSGYSYPSLVGESGTMTFTISGINSGSSTEGIITDVTTSPTTVPFGTVTPNTVYEAAQRLSVESNANFGYAIFAFSDNPLENADGAEISSFVGSNETPGSWTSLCEIGNSCVGYHAGDDTLDGVAARFSSDDSYAGFATSAKTIMYNNNPGIDYSDIIYRLQINPMQASGDYVSDIVFVAVPTF